MSDESNEPIPTGRMPLARITPRAALFGIADEISTCGYRIKNSADRYKSLEDASEKDEMLASVGRMRLLCDDLEQAIEKSRECV